MHSEFLFLAINTISENICRKEQIEDDLLSIYTALKLLQTKKAAQIAYKTFGKLYKRIILTVCWFIDNDISIKESIDYYIDNTARIKDANMYLTNHPLNHISDINE
jgi:hypothetical protein